MVVSVVGALFISFASLTNSKERLGDFYSKTVPLQGQMCQNNSEQHYEIESPQEPNILGIVMIFWGLVLAGIGNTIFRSLSISYLDDNVSRQFAPITLCLSMVVRFCGPILGLALASSCLKVYVYPR